MTRRNERSQMVSVRVPLDLYERLKARGPVAPQMVEGARMALADPFLDEEMAERAGKWFQPPPSATP